MNFKHNKMKTNILLKIVLLFIGIFFSAVINAQEIQGQTYAITSNASVTDTQPYIAAMNNSALSVQILCQHGADVNAKDGRGKTPLYIAASSNLKEIVQILCQHGADVDAKNFEFQSPLHIAA